MSGVQARFYVAEVTHSAHQPKGACRTVLQAVSRGDQNREWSAATPAGRIEMTINAEPAATWFAEHLGDDVAITFAAVPAFRPEDGHPFRESLAEPGTAYGPPYCGDCARPKAEHQS